MVKRLLSGSLAVMLQLTQSAAADPAVLTLEQAAALLRTSPNAVSRLAASGQIPGRRLGRHWRFSRTAVLDWLAGTATSELATVRGRGATSASAPPARSEPIGERPEAGSAGDVFLREQAVLLEPGQWTVELDLIYGRSERNLFELSPVGDLTPITLERDFFATNLALQYGLGKGTELFATLPWVYEQETLHRGAATETLDERSELGDGIIGLRHTLLSEALGRPEVIASVLGKIPTGEGSYGVGVGVSLVKRSDPAALYADLEYLHTFSRESDDLGKLEPRHSLAAGLGYALAFNDKLSVSTSFNSVFNSRTRFRQAELPAEERFFLDFGLTYQLNKKLYLEPKLSVGLNGDPGFTFQLSIPYTF